ncbi:MAG: phosphatidylglycerophosphatase A [Desulfamplus sp.]|nr:phosphatidylglycerophosphatase A [Desulfamplus sp.]
MESINHSNTTKIIIGSAFGLGLIPIMPGTFGALLGVIVHLLIIFFLPIKLQYVCLIIFFLMVCIANHVLTPWAVDYWKSKDPKQFVLDEVAGYLVVPMLFQGSNLLTSVLLGFVLFRVYDIIKLPIARQIDRNLHGPFGILLDDIVSGIYASITLYILLWLGIIK